MPIHAPRRTVRVVKSRWQTRIMAAATMPSVSASASTTAMASAPKTIGTA